MFCDVLNGLLDNTALFKLKEFVVTVLKNLLKNSFILVVLLFSSFIASKDTIDENAKKSAMPLPANGINFPAGYQDWNVVAVSHREDNKTLRAIIGNPAAILAIENGLTNPWPNGVVLGKMVWKDRQDKHWNSATVPAKFIHAEFMFKDSKKWEKTGGWGWARWLGTEQKPFGVGDHSASASCVACHTPVKGKDWVYTTPAIMPKRVN